MADEADKEKKEDSKAEENGVKAKETDEAKSSGLIGSLLPWIVMAVVVAVFSAAGFGLGRLFAGSAAPEEGESSQQSQPAQIEKLKADGSAAASQRSWYYDLEPVVANLDVPGATRYVRTQLTLEISAEMDPKKTTPFLEERKPLLTNWLTIYLASLTLEDIRGDRNLRRIQSQILDSFNERLFPDAKPRIKHVLFKEFAIQ